MGSLRVRLTVAFVAVALAGITVTAVATGAAISRRFDVYVGRYQRLRAERAARILEEAYRTGGMPQAVREAERLSGMIGMHARLVDANGNVVWESLPRSNQFRTGPGPSSPPGPRWRRGHFLGQHAIPLRVGGEQVGTLYVATPEGSPWVAEELAFLGGVRRSLWLAVGAAALVAVVVGLAVARSISRPLLALRDAAEKLRQGDRTTQVPERGSDEVVALARAFNHLARSLARQEELRRNLTADVAHELRTPLAVVRSHIEAMQDGLWEASPENLAALHAEIMRLVRLVGELERLNEAESGSLELVWAEVDLAELTRRVTATFAPAFEQEGVALRLEFEPGTPAVAGDEDRFSQVVWNLLSNALKFTPPGGEVTVGIRGEGGFVRLAVTDTGPGIPADDLPYVFERFFRARRGEIPSPPAPGQPERGTGLGLAISQALARAHGGRIEVHSEPGRGSTFTLVLPARSQSTTDAPGR